MEYRLLENLAGTGILGQVFDIWAFRAMPFYNRALFEPVQDERFYIYSLKTTKGHVRHKYLLEDLFQVSLLLDKLDNIDGWVKSGILTAASELRPYKFTNHYISIKLIVHGD